mmetsp:Transcript_17271/g.37083  ORF Transcript_17271/g.37083 Transcript_17271/m.37083 type:complete len:271 (+) Transcript_17271:423-1235(+)
MQLPVSVVTLPASHPSPPFSATASSTPFCSYLCLRCTLQRVSFVIACHVARLIAYPVKKAEKSSSFFLRAPAVLTCVPLRARLRTRRATAPASFTIWSAAKPGRSAERRPTLSRRTLWRARRSIARVRTICRRARAAFTCWTGGLRAAQLWRTTSPSRSTDSKSTRASSRGISRIQRRWPDQPTHPTSRPTNTSGCQGFGSLVTFTGDCTSSAASTQASAGRRSRSGLTSRLHASSTCRSGARTAAADRPRASWRPYARVALRCDWSHRG